LISLVIELIDSSSMYASGGPSCLDGAITKCISVVSYLIPDDEKTKTTKKYDISAVSFDIFPFFDSIVKNFKYDEWKKLEDFQKFQLICADFYKLFKGKECSDNIIIYKNSFLNDKDKQSALKQELELPDICILSKKLLLQDLNQNVNPKKDLINKISIHFEEQYQNEKIKEKFLSKITEEIALYNKIKNISPEDIAKIVEKLDLNDISILCEVLRSLDKDESFINKMVCNDSYQKFIKDEAFPQQESVVGGFNSNEQSKSTIAKEKKFNGFIK